MPPPQPIATSGRVSFILRFGAGTLPTAGPGIQEGAQGAIRRVLRKPYTPRELLRATAEVLVPSG